MENFFPDWWLRRKHRNKEPEQFFTAAQERFTNLKTDMLDRGLSHKTISEMSALTNQVLGLPSDVQLDMPLNDFLSVFKEKAPESREQVLYGLQRYPMVMIDHFASLFDAVQTNNDWKTVHWIFQGLMGHPENKNLNLTAQPIGLITKTLAQQMENNSPLWQATTQIVGYYDGLLNEAFAKGNSDRIKGGVDGKYYVVGKAETDETRQAQQAEKERFVQDTLYEWMRQLTPPQDENPRLSQFVSKQLPDILNRFRENYPPPKAVLDEGGGHPDYFAKLQPNLLNNVMLLLMQTDRMSRSSFTEHPPHGPQPMEVINHTPFNHLLRPDSEGGDA